MSTEAARAHLRAFGVEERILEFDVSSATVELAAFRKRSLLKRKAAAC